MNKKCFQTALVFSMIFFTAAYAAAHCEIPCGIYDDEMRVRMIAEHITTIEKSMNQIVRLRGQKAGDGNQSVRWVMNKDDHANKLQHIVSQYFMTQRIKLDTEKYSQKIERASQDARLCHEVQADHRSFPHHHVAVASEGIPGPLFRP